MVMVMVLEVELALIRSENIASLRAEMHTAALILDSTLALSTYGSSEERNVVSHQCQQWGVLTCELLSEPPMMLVRYCMPARMVVSWWGG
jgi:hypothetical protein